MKHVFKLFAGDPAQLDQLIKSEVLFAIDGSKVWMPIQQPLEKPLKKEVKKGAEALLYCLFLNEHTHQKALYLSLLVSEFRTE